MEPISFFLNGVEYLTYVFFLLGFFFALKDKSYGYVRNGRFKRKSQDKYKNAATKKELVYLIENAENEKDKQIFLNVIKNRKRSKIMFLCFGMSYVLFIVIKTLVEQQ